MNIDKIQQRINEAKALMEQLQPIIEETRRQEQTIINHRVKLESQMASLRESVNTYEGWIENAKE